MCLGLILQWQTEKANSYFWVRDLSPTSDGWLTPPPNSLAHIEDCTHLRLYNNFLAWQGVVIFSNKILVFSLLLWITVNSDWVSPCVLLDSASSKEHSTNYSFALDSLVGNVSWVWSVAWVLSPLHLFAHPSWCTLLLLCRRVAEWCVSINLMGNFLFLKLNQIFSNILKHREPFKLQVVAHIMRNLLNIEKLSHSLSKVSHIMPDLRVYILNFHQWNTHIFIFI